MKICCKCYVVLITGDTVSSVLSTHCKLVSLFTVLLYDAERLDLTSQSDATLLSLNEALHCIKTLNTNLYLSSVKADNCISLLSALTQHTTPSHKAPNDLLRKMIENAAATSYSEVLRYAVRRLLADDVTVLCLV